MDSSVETTETAEKAYLIDAIKERIRASGPLTFAEFMELALYAPGHGYYTSDKEPWAGGGDYITNLDLGPAFANTVARQIIELWEALGGGRFTLVEAGAGRGTLSLGILDALRSRNHPLYKLIDVRLVERNRREHRTQETPHNNVAWHASLDKAGPVESGCILSNELIDSLPFHRVVFTGLKLREVFTAYEDGRFIDRLGEPSTPELDAYLCETGVSLVKGQAAEINLLARDWITEAGRLVEKGFVMTIDYGLPGRELYAIENGPTLHCHRRHKLNNDPYAHIGSQDITAHVDFTALAAAGTKAGLELTGFTTQKNFLLGLGILDELQTPGELDAANIDKINANRMIKDLIMPQSMGDTFKVLIQHKGIAKPALKGLSWRDMSRYLRAVTT